MGLLVPASYRSGRFFLRNGSEREWLNIRNSENDKTLTRFYYSATLLFTLTIQLSVPAISIAQSQYRFQHYDNKDGLADDFVWSIAQDSLGHMWFQYYGGLTRYDGNSFKAYKYDKEDQRRSALNFILGRINTDPNKMVWITMHHGNPNSPYTLVKINLKGESSSGRTNDFGLCPRRKW